MKDHLKKCFLFRNWNDNELTQLANTCFELELSIGQTLFLEDDVSDSLFVVKSGSINIEKTSGEKDQMIACIDAGSYFGELGILADQPGLDKRSASATAKENTSVIKIPYAGLLTFIKSNPIYGAAFYKNIAVALSLRIQKTSQDLASLKALRLRSL